MPPVKSENPGQSKINLRHMFFRANLPYKSHDRDLWSITPRMPFLEMANMDNSSLLAKIPLILASCIGTHITWTAPAQSGKTEELPASDWLEQFMNIAVPRVWLIRTAWWTIGTAEIATILLHELAPSSPMLPPNAHRLGVHAASQLGVVLIALGAGLRFVCYKHMASHFTFELSIRAKHKLVTTGPYSIVRHPSYSGIVMVYAGLVLWHCTSGSWIRESGILENVFGRTLLMGFASIILLIMYCLLSRIPKEDGKLREVFGKEWDEYARKVPYVLFPGIL